MFFLLPVTFCCVCSLKAVHKNCNESKVLPFPHLNFWACWCSLCNISWSNLKSSKVAQTPHTDIKNNNTPLCQHYSLSKLCCIGTWGVLSLLSQDRWMSLSGSRTDRFKAGFREVTTELVRGAVLCTPAPSWQPCNLRSAHTKGYTGAFFISSKISFCLTLALTQVFPPETRTLTKYLVLPRSS